jgi:hypothetical protein
MAGDVMPREGLGPLPPPSAELWLIGAFVAAFMRIKLRRRERAPYLAEVRNLLIAGATPALGVPTEDASRALAARREALSWLDAAEPIIRSLCDL